MPFGCSCTFRSFRPVTRLGTRFRTEEDSGNPPANVKRICGNPLPDSPGNPFSYSRQKTVIASGAKQSLFSCVAGKTRDCFVASLLAMTSWGLPLRPARPETCHCERSEAISLWGSLSRVTRDFTPRNHKSTPLLTEVLLFPHGIP